MIHVRYISLNEERNNQKLNYNEFSGAKFEIEIRGVVGKESHLECGINQRLWPMRTETLFFVHKQGIPLFIAK